MIEEGATFIGKSEVTSGTGAKMSSAPAHKPEIVRNDEPVTPIKPRSARAHSREAFHRS